MELSTIHFFYVILAVTNMVLDTRQNILGRPLGLIANGISVYIYYSAGFYAKCLLKCIFVVLNIYGWYQWLYGGENKTRLKVSKTPYSQLVIVAILGLSVAWGLGKTLTLCSSATFPYWDSLLAVMALTAYWMLVRKKLEAWLLLVPTDALYATLLCFKGLYLLSSLHLCYTILATNGYRNWHQSYRQEKNP